MVNLTNTSFLDLHKVFETLSEPTGEIGQYGGGAAGTNSGIYSLASELDELKAEYNSEKPQLAMRRFNFLTQNEESDNTSSAEKKERACFEKYFDQKDKLKGVIKKEFKKLQPDIKEYLRKGYNVKGIDKELINQIEEMLHRGSSAYENPGLRKFMLRTNEYLQKLKALVERSPKLQSAIDEANNMLNLIHDTLQTLKITESLAVIDWAKNVDKVVNVKLNALAEETIEKLNEDPTTAVSEDNYVIVKNKLLGLMSSQSYQLTVENFKFKQLKNSLLAEDIRKRIKLKEFIDKKSDHILNEARDAREYAMRNLHDRYRPTAPGRMGPIAKYEAGLRKHDRYIAAVDGGSASDISGKNPLTGNFRPEKCNESMHTHIARAILTMSEALGEAIIVFRQQSKELEPSAEEKFKEYKDLEDKIVANAKKVGNKIKERSDKLYCSINKIGLELQKWLLKKSPRIDIVMSESAKNEILNAGLLLRDQYQQIERLLRQLLIVAWELQEGVEQLNSLQKQTVRSSVQPVLDELLNEQLELEKARWENKIKNSQKALTKLLASIDAVVQERRQEKTWHDVSQKLKTEKTEEDEWRGFRQFYGILESVIEKYSTVASEVGDSALRLASHGHEGGKELAKNVEKLLLQLSPLKNLIGKEVTRITGESLGYFSRAGMLARGIAEWAENLKQDYLYEINPENKETAIAIFEKNLVSVISDAYPALRTEKDPNLEVFIKKLELELKHASENNIIYPPTPEEIIAGTLNIKGCLKQWAQKKVPRGAVTAALKGGFTMFSTPLNVPTKLLIRGLITGLILHQGNKAINRGIRFQQGPATRIKNKFIEKEIFKAAYKAGMSTIPLLGWLGAGACTLKQIYDKEIALDEYITDSLADLPEDMFWRGVYAGFGTIYGKVVWEKEKEQVITGKLEEMMGWYNVDRDVVKPELVAEIYNYMKKDPEFQIIVFQLMAAIKNSPSREDVPDFNKRLAIQVIVNEYLKRTKCVISPASEVVRLSGNSAIEKQDAKEREPGQDISANRISEGSKVYTINNTDNLPTRFSRVGRHINFPVTEINETDIEYILRNTPEMNEWEVESESSRDFMALKNAINNTMKEVYGPQPLPVATPIMGDGETICLRVINESSGAIESENIYIYFGGQYWPATIFGKDGLYLNVGGEGFTIKRIPGAMVRWKEFYTSSYKFDYYSSYVLHDNGNNKIDEILKNEMHRIYIENNCYINLKSFTEYLNIALDIHIKKARWNGDELTAEAFERVEKNIRVKLADLQHADPNTAEIDKTSYSKPEAQDRESQNNYYDENIHAVERPNPLYTIPANFTGEESEVNDYFHQIRKEEVVYYRGLEKIHTDMLKAMDNYNMSLNAYFSMTGRKAEDFESPEEIKTLLNSSINNNDKNISAISKKCLQDQAKLQLKEEEINEYFRKNHIDVLTRSELWNVAEKIDLEMESFPPPTIQIDDLNKRLMIAKEELEKRGGGSEDEKREIARTKFRLMYSRKFLINEAVENRSDDTEFGQQKNYSELPDEQKSKAYYNALKYTLFQIENDPKIPYASRINAHEARMGKERVTQVDVYGYTFVNCLFIPDKPGAKTGVLVDLSSPKKYYYIADEKDLKKELEGRLPYTSAGSYIYDNGFVIFRKIKKGEIDFDKYFNYIRRARTDIITIADRLYKEFEENKISEIKDPRSKWLYEIYSMDSNKKINWTTNEDLMVKAACGAKIDDADFKANKTLYKGEFADQRPLHLKILYGIAHPAESSARAIQNNISINKKESSEQAQINIDNAVRTAQWIDPTFTLIVTLLPGGFVLPIAQSSSEITANIIEGKSPDPLAVASLVVSFIPGAKVAKIIRKFSRTGAAIVSYGLVIADKVIDIAGLALSIKIAVETGDPLHIYMACLDAGMSSRNGWITTKIITNNIKLKNSLAEPLSRATPEVNNAHMNVTERKTVHTKVKDSFNEKPNNKIQIEEKKRTGSLPKKNHEIRPLRPAKPYHIPPAERTHPFVFYGRQLLGRKKHGVLEISSDNGQTWTRGSDIHMFAYVLQNAGYSRRDNIPERNSFGSEEHCAEALKAGQNPKKYFQTLKSAKPNESARSFNADGKRLKGRVRNGVFEISRNGGDTWQNGSWMHEAVWRYRPAAKLSSKELDKKINRASKIEGAASYSNICYSTAIKNAGQAESLTPRQTKWLLETVAKPDKNGEIMNSDRYRQTFDLQTRPPLTTFKSGNITQSGFIHVGVIRKNGTVIYDHVAYVHVTAKGIYMYQVNGGDFILKLNGKYPLEKFNKIGKYTSRNHFKHTMDSKTIKNFDDYFAKPDEEGYQPVFQYTPATKIVENYFNDMHAEGSLEPDVSAMPGTSHYRDNPNSPSTSFEQAGNTPYSDVSENKSASSQKEISEASQYTQKKDRFAEPFGPDSYIRMGSDNRTIVIRAHGAPGSTGHFTARDVVKVIREFAKARNVDINNINYIDLQCCYGNTIRPFSQGQVIANLLRVKVKGYSGIYSPMANSLPSDGSFSVPYSNRASVLISDVGNIAVYQLTESVLSLRRRLGIGRLQEPVDRGEVYSLRQYYRPAGSRRSVTIPESFKTLRLGRGSADVTSDTNNSTITGDYLIAESPDRNSDGREILQLIREMPLRSKASAGALTGGLLILGAGATGAFNAENRRNALKEVEENLIDIKSLSSNYDLDLKIISQQYFGNEHLGADDLQKIILFINMVRTMTTDAELEQLSSGILPERFLDYVPEVLQRIPVERFLGFYIEIYGA
ncbi:hypothetical protein [Kalamiella sp. sgz302252]|uniref:hypothetical protein n=1 Tax=Pantoea sp. sgz302252 TaxID=3341827 RepID=UPI0036D2650D